MSDMEPMRRLPDTDKTSAPALDTYEPPMIVSIGRLDDLTRGNGGKGGDAMGKSSLPPR